jgi:hypothetical protein
MLLSLAFMFMALFFAFQAYDNYEKTKYDSYLYLFFFQLFCSGLQFFIFLRMLQT